MGLHSNNSVGFKTNQKSFGMKAIVKFLFIVLLIFTLTEARVYCQLVAIGHVTAEVIESVSAASTANTSFELSMLAVHDNKNQKQAGVTSETIDLGAITLHSGNDVTCNIVFNSAALSDKAGNVFTISPSLKNKTLASVALPSGEQKILIDGKTNRTSNQPTGLYHGSYSVVFAYN